MFNRSNMEDECIHKEEEKIWELKEDISLELLPVFGLTCALLVTTPNTLNTVR